ncbi:hypothetical protein M408DRAFT_6314 [Serendipita vermifera MAFF 305830]|uniref:Uncharacterized protein n=1 Tax=Serendipita vermifera MAFF 305830 TaxID=933852 RepID=A0A0C2X3Z1_SERVB|nr:hypothetical protein M408DRAFT_6314 [Serendipita vermifera MAFF 305830]
MQSMASPSTSYAAPAIISLGEEYTDETMVSSTSTSPESHSGYDDGYYYSSSSDSETESSSDEEEQSDSSDYRPTHNRRRSSIAPSLWQAEHARLLSLQTAVLDNERAAWSREKRLESEVARIKFDLARLQRQQIQTQQQESSSCRTLTSPEATATSPPLPSSSSSTQIPPPPRCAGPRGPRPKPQQTLLQLHRSTPPSHSTVVAATTGASAAQTRTGSAPLLPKFSFESLKGAAAGNGSKPEEHTTAVSVLSHHLTEARSLRAQERQKRRIQHERMRELATLLTLGSEVRKWEERLAWSQIQSNTRAAAADDSQLNKESVAKAEAVAEADTDTDPRGKRLSRSSSLPSNRMSSYLAAPSNAAQSTSSTSSANRPPLSPALPSLSLSPMWKVSAEMILRRRQLSERPRRTPPAPLAVATSPSPAASSGNGSKPPVLAVPVAPKPAATVPVPVSLPMSTSPATPATTPITATTTMSTSTTTLARPAHTLRGPREKRSVSSTASSPASPPANSVSAPITILSPTLMTVPSPSASSSPTGSGNGALSASASSLSGKRNSIPPPISIPPNGPFCTTTITVTAPGPGSPKSGSITGSTPPSSTCNFFISKTTPVRPSALKWAFTAADLAREMQAEEEEVRQKEMQQQEACCVSSESESSASDDSCQSSSDGSGHSSSSSDSQESIIQTPPPSSGNVERRGRARFSWRKSIPKDGTASAETPPLPTPFYSITLFAYCTPCTMLPIIRLQHNPPLELYELDAAREQMMDHNELSRLAIAEPAIISITTPAIPTFELRAKQKRRTL